MMQLPRDALTYDKGATKTPVVWTLHAEALSRDKNPLHYIPILARKPGALRNGAPFREWSMPPGLTGGQARIGRSNDGDRQFAAILAAILTDSLDAVEAACLEALTAGPCSRDVVLTILARRRTPPPQPSAAVPAALTLKIEPAANCNRYDALLTRTAEAANGTA